MTTKQATDWTPIASVKNADITAEISRRSDRWRCTTRQTGHEASEGRGPDVASAISDCRADMRWPNLDGQLCKTYERALRKLLHLAEDSEYPWILSGSMDYEDDEYPLHVEIYQQDERWKCLVLGHGHETEGRGNSPEDAIDSCRQEVLSWAVKKSHLYQGYIGVFRRILYAIDDMASTSTETLSINVDIDAAVERILGTIMTNSDGDAVARLALQMPDGRDCGGWYRESLADRIRESLLGLEA